VLGARRHTIPIRITIGRNSHGYENRHSWSGTLCASPPSGPDHLLLILFGQKDPITPEMPFDAAWISITPSERFLHTQACSQPLRRNPGRAIGCRYWPPCFPQTKPISSDIRAMPSRTFVEPHTGKCARNSSIPGRFLGAAGAGRTWELGAVGHAEWTSVFRFPVLHWKAPTGTMVCAQWFGSRCHRGVPNVKNGRKPARGRSLMSAVSQGARGDGARMLIVLPDESGHDRTPITDTRCAP